MAQVRMLLGYLGYQATEFPERLDLLDVRPETLAFAYDANVNRSFCVEGRETNRLVDAYRQHTADTYLRYQRFMEAYYKPCPYSLRPYKWLPLGPGATVIIKISIDRLQLPKEEFQQEMQELINFFFQTQRFQVGQPPGFNILLSREEFQEVIRQGPQELNKTIDVECAGGEKVSVNLVQLAQLRPHLITKRWSQEKTELDTCTKETLLIALKVLQTNTLPFMTPEQTIALLELFDYCGIVRDDLNELIAKTPPVFSEEKLKMISWEGLNEYLDPFIQNGQEWFRAGKEVYSIKWVQANCENLKKLGSPATLATKFLTTYSLEDLKNNFSKWELLSFTVLMHFYERNVAEIDPLLRQKSMVEFGNDELWSSPDKYWGDIQKFLIKYPEAQRITLAGSSIQWSRGEVEAFVAHSKITKEELNSSIEIVLQDSNNYLVTVGGNKEYITVSLAMWKAFSKTEPQAWAKVEGWWWRSCWNAAFCTQENIYSLRHAPKFCKCLLTDYANKKMPLTWFNGG